MAANKLRLAKLQRETYYNKLKETFSIAQSSRVDALKRTLFQAHLLCLDDVYNTFQKVHNNCIALIESDDDFQIHDEIRSKADSLFFSSKAIEAELFEPSQKVTADPSTHNSNGVKLPLIEIPLFDSDIRNFQTFIDLFDSLIHNNDTLSDVSKFHYLISLVKGSAHQLVTLLPVTQANYQTAYASLRKRFGNKRAIANEHYQQLVNAKFVHKGDSQGLRNLLDTFQGCLGALRNLGFDVAGWDYLIFQMLLAKVDASLRTEFELKHSDVEIPCYDALYRNLEQQCKAFESLQLSTSSSQLKPVAPGKSKGTLNNKRSAFIATDQETDPHVSRGCPLCKGLHSLHQCHDFLTKSTSERFDFIKQSRFCVNCFGGHRTRLCRSKLRCKSCNGRHSSLLHRIQPDQATIVEATSSSPVASASVTASCTSALISNSATILLGTGQAEIRDASGTFQKCRFLCDSGSMCSFISKKCLNKLGMRCNRKTIPIEGLSDMSLSTQGTVNCVIRPIGQTAPSFQFEAVTLSKICSEQPKMVIDSSAWAHLRNLRLADAKFNVPGEIDLLIGCEILPYIFGSHRVFGNIDQPVAVESAFGYILSGRVSNTPSFTSKPVVLHSFHASLSTTESLNECLEKFWTVESVTAPALLSPDDERVEQLYKDSVTRNPSGRFCVSLPFKTPKPHFGDTYHMARRRFLHLEKRLALKPEISAEYNTFMRDYLDSGHMSVVRSEDHKTPNGFYIPHHYVLKPESTTTKLRVVFDASAKGTGGNSLNDELLVGPKLQKDIFTILCNFRKDGVAFTADLRQMYRQILISPEHRSFQRILFRFSPTEPLREFELSTVTYGVSCSPYLALRTLLELADREAEMYPQAAEVIRKHTYIDDLVVSVKDVSSALDLKNQLNGIFSSAGFELHKWNSNTAALLDNSSAQDSINFDKQEPYFTKVLGMQWNPREDDFSYSINLVEHPEFTKRNILSDIARLFDPMGFVSPVIIVAKQIMQRLWLHKINWDDQPPQDIIDMWERFRRELPSLSQVRIPRQIVSTDNGKLELHGFSDASSTSYGCVIFVRAQTSSGKVSVHLCCGKSRVAPVKTVSLPRLELLGAVLLTDLMSKILNLTQYKFDQVTAWCDSEIVLCWLASHPSKWKTFVANRVSHIQESLPSVRWLHVPTEINPADCVSRGLFPSQFVDFDLWFRGPPYLLESEDHWPSQPLFLPNRLVEIEAKLSVNLVIEQGVHFLDQLLAKHSSLQKILRIIAYMRRFIKGMKQSVRAEGVQISPEETQEALLTLIKHVQTTSFAEVRNALIRNRIIPKQFRKLNVILDERGLLTVGGRLRHSSLPFETKFPLLLPNKHALTERIIVETHQRFLHPGHRTLSYLLLQQYWILGARRAIQRCLSACNRCFRAKPIAVTPLMGDLPAFRVNQIRAFRSVCVDYAGPFIISMTRARGVKTTKAYVCIFVCTTVKAVHLELASDLSSEAFLAAFQRFVARRGACTVLHSDQGTNFVGAHNLLQKLATKSQSKLDIVWHFNPPSAPNFNGLAEAGVKSVKTHLTRVMGDQALTYEEFYTLLTRIEAVLNSRPLSASSSDPNDLQPLTPGHFLNLEPLNSALPEPDISEIPIGRLGRWQLLQRMHSDFWQRWHKEYLHTLQQRSKWYHATQNIEIGTLVLVKHDSKPPNSWELARVVQTHPGSDGLIRVVTIRGRHGLFQRPVSKLCPLPSQ